MGLCRFADMQDCAMRLGDGRVPGICLCVFHGYAPSRGLLFSHPMPVGRVLVLWFLSHPMLVRI